MRIFVLFSFIVLSVFLSSCGKSSGSVEISSGSFGTSGATEVNDQSFSLIAENPVTEVTEFKVCVRKIRFENEDDEAEKNDDDHDEFEVFPGLIDLSKGESKDWGKIEVPVDFKLKRIKVKVQKHFASCGVDYSVKFNGETATRDIEFRFRFDPPIELEAGDKIKLSLATVVAALRRAADSGSLNRIHEHIAAVEGNASKEKH